MPQEQKEKIPLPKLLEAILPYQAGVYVTVLNIIQCIALAFLINEAKETVGKGELNLLWILRSAVALTIILVVWHRYVVESQYLWPMSLLDTLIPFSMGITECVIIFSTNAEKVSLQLFIGGVIALQLVAVIAYRYAFFKRTRGITERLYKDAYSDFPQFPFHLLSFLRNYDKENITRISIFFVVSWMFFAFIYFYPVYIYEIIFPVIYFIELIQGEVFHSFHRSLKKDKFLGPFFEPKGEKS